MDKIGCAVAIPAEMQGIAPGEEWKFMRRIGRLSEETVRLAVFVGLTDVMKLKNAPKTAFEMWRSEPRLNALVEFLATSQEPLLNHHSFRHFKEIPQLLQTASDFLALSVCATRELLQTSNEKLLPSLRNYEITVCWRGSEADFRADFLLSWKGEQLFTLYREFKLPLWAKLCCGCLSSVPYDHEVSEETLVNRNCAHHSREELQQSVLLLKPLECELRIEENVLSGAPRGQCMKCKKSHFLFKAAGFCSMNCQICLGCAAKIYQFPCFPCPNCGTPCREDMLDAMYEAFCLGPPQPQSQFAVDQYPTCQNCYKIYSKHLFSCFGSVHSTCNLCVECFCHATAACPCCNRNFDSREKRLQQQLTPHLGRVCASCFGGHTCRKDECAICEYRSLLVTFLGIRECKACRRSLLREDATDSEEGQKDCEWEEEKTEENEDAGTFPRVSEKEVTAVPQLPIDTESAAASSAPSVNFGVDQYTFRPDTSRCNHRGENNHVCVDGTEICRSCYASLQLASPLTRKCQYCGKSTREIFPDLNEREEFPCEHCKNFYKISNFLYKSRCLHHRICIQCSGTAANSTNGQHECPMCTQFYTYDSGVCSECRENLASRYVHREDSAACQLCWKCAKVSDESPFTCRLCKKELSDFFVEKYTISQGRQCEICWNYRFFTVNCSRCHLDSCVFCLEKDSFACQRCGTVAYSGYSDTQYAKYWQDRCSLCYSYSPEVVEQDCGHSFHAGCYRSVGSCQLESHRDRRK